MLISNPRKAMAAVLLIGVLALITGSAPVISSITGALVVVLPGWLLAQAALAHRPTIRLAERVMLGLGMELVALLACGLFLGMLGQVTRVGWVITLTAVSAVATALIKRPGPQTPAPNSVHDYSAMTDRPRRSTIAWGALTAAFGIAALVVSVTSAQSAPRESFSELWALPAPAAQGVPNAKTRPRIQLGVRSRESDTERFVVTLLEGRNERGRWQINLAPGQEWTTEVTTKSPSTVTARLEKLGATTNPYRTVTLSAETRAAAETQAGALQPAVPE